MSKLHAFFGGLLVVAAIESSAHAALVAYWPFDTDTSGVTPDIVNGNDASLFGTASIAFDAGRNSNVLTLGGTGIADAGVQNGDDLDMGLGNFTIAGWFKTSTVNTARTTLIWFNDYTSPNPGYQVELNANATTSRSRTILDDGDEGAFPTGATGLSDTTWHHFAAVVENTGLPSGTGTWYIDGVQISQVSTAALESAISPINTTHFTMGASYATNAFNPAALMRALSGSLDDFAAWKDALPTMSIAGLANGTYTPLTAPVPEPTSFVMIVIGIIVGGYRLRRRRRGDQS
jgi:hypothetical protein